MKFIAKQNTWFKAGTECTLDGEYPDKCRMGFFQGIRICENPASEDRKIGEEYCDDELCSYDEFEITEN